MLTAMQPSCLPRCGITRLGSHLEGESNQQSKLAECTHYMQMTLCGNNLIWVINVMLFKKFCTIEYVDGDGGIFGWCGAKICTNILSRNSSKVENTFGVVSYNFRFYTNPSTGYVVVEQIGVVIPVHVSRLDVVHCKPGDNNGNGLFHRK